MIQKIVTGHGTFPKSLCESVEMIAGHCDELQSVNFPPSMGCDQLSDTIASLIQKGDAKQVVIFVDLLQATPFRAAALAAIRFPQKKIYVITGVNTAMLLEAVLSKEDDAEKLAGELVSNAGNALKVLEPRSMFNR